MAVSKIDLGEIATSPLKMMPVGYVYMSFDSTSPAKLFGGSWTQITGRFLRAASDTNTGGSDTVTLTTGQMPSHNHANILGGVNTAGADANALLGSAKNAPAGYTSGTDRWGAWFGSGYEAVSNVKTSNSGSSLSHNNMPAYQDVYAWRRIA